MPTSTEVTGSREHKERPSLKEASDPLPAQQPLVPPAFQLPCETGGMRISKPGLQDSKLSQEGR